MPSPRSIAIWTALLLVALNLSCTKDGGRAATAKKDGEWTVFGPAGPAAKLKSQAQSIEAALHAQTGADVIVSGRVGKVCPAGCWFYLHDDADLVYIDVEGDFEVPPDCGGSRAVVRAKTSGEGGSRILQASAVLLAPE